MLTNKDINEKTLAVLKPLLTTFEEKEVLDSLLLGAEFNVTSTNKKVKI